MFITRTRKKIYVFYIDKKEDREDFEDLLNNPAVTILNKVYLTETETSYEGDSSVTTERPYVRVECEECSL